MTPHRRTPNFSLAVVMARRELRGGLKGFRVFLACLALGVAAVAGVGSVGTAVNEGLRQDARKLLGGDVDLRLVHRPAAADRIAFLESQGAVSQAVEMRAMARGVDGERRQLVELKAVDDPYPLYGAIELDGAADIRQALAERDGRFGAVADRAVLEALDLALGDIVRLGDADFELRATIVREPDRTTRIFGFGPRLMVAQAALDSTGLIQPGSLVSYHYRLRLPAEISVADWVKDLKELYPEAGWRIRDRRNASPGLKSFIDRLTVYLSLVGLTALLVGGVGIAGAVRNYLDGKVGTIATMKCLGAPNRLVFRVYMTQVLILALGGILVGLFVGAVAPLLLAPLIADQLPIATRFGFYAQPLVLAASYGLLIAAVFSIWPLAQARDVPAAALFRSLVAPPRRRPPTPYLVALAALATLLGALAIASAEDHWLAMWFVIGAIATLLIFRGAAALIGRLAELATRRRLFTGGRPGLRMAIANLHRPGAPTTSVVLSLGIGLTVLAAVALVEGNLARQVNEQIPERAPTFFFIDIQPDQVAAFDAAVTGIPGVTGLSRVPSLRGRIAAIDGVPVEEAEIAPDAKWAVRNERGLTYATEIPNGSTVVAGEWWPADYAGPPLLSFDEKLAAGMGLEVGDTLTVNVLGREVTATIGNLRRIDWTSLGINFTIVFAPGALEGAPQTHIATASAPPELETPLLRAVTDTFANVSAIRVKDALEQINRILQNIADAMRVNAGVALLAGALVLAGAVTAGHHRRVYDAVVLKVLGARRREVLRAFLIEYGLLGIASAIIAGALGTIAAWAVLTQVMRTEWVFLPGTLVVTGLVCVVVTLVFGFAGTWRALNRKAAPLLRNE
ncbi:MAG: FtsX-like permease family protein [Alphaproteobacteria bacterium]|nr:FtsX-like permease family protein [Alphaproteobacteria bacterium]